MDSEQLKKMFIGTFFWTIVCSTTVFIMLLTASESDSIEIIAIQSWRLLVIIFGTNFLLNLVLIKLNN